MTASDLATLRNSLEAAQHRHDVLAAPAEESDWASFLLAFAEMTGAAEPAEEGLALYFKALKDIPAVILPLAQVDLAQTHVFKRLPNPAEILNACRPYLNDLAANRKWFKLAIEAIDEKLTRLSAG